MGVRGRLVRMHHSLVRAVKRSGIAVRTGVGISDHWVARPGAERLQSASLQSHHLGIGLAPADYICLFRQPARFGRDAEKLVLASWALFDGESSAVRVWQFARGDAVPALPHWLMGHATRHTPGIRASILDS